MDRLETGWFLAPEERGNESTDIDALVGVPWTTGNRVTALIHGHEYFQRLDSVLSELRGGDTLLIADWRGDPDERLVDGGSPIGPTLHGLASRGVNVFGLIWGSHSRLLGFDAGGDRHLAQVANAGGARIVLDRRVLPGGSHHQKLVLLHFKSDPSRDVAFVGGIDLCHGRRDDERHLGDPQREQFDEAYGTSAPWHDVQAEVRGPAVAQLWQTFRERWNDPTPPSRLWPLRSMAFGAEEATREHLEPMTPSGATGSGSGVQVLRTYPSRRTPFPFAPEGERSIARLYLRLFERARSLIYVEDQYMWSSTIGKAIARAMDNSPDLILIAVVPRYPERSGRLTRTAYQLGQSELFDAIREVDPNRVAVFDLENERGTPIYVHSKVVVVDDEIAVIGSDNLNMRSWTHDSELALAVGPGEGDDDRTFARSLRRDLWREHLGTDQLPDDPRDALRLWHDTAERLERWHAQGTGERPPGRVRVHDTGRPPRASRLAHLLYRRLLDPDGRPTDRRDGF
jgi:phosphatidylserine/phosphatidylglycerophosphate/cardiolipin synthase-like enzyme